MKWLRMFVIKSFLGPSCSCSLTQFHCLKFNYNLMLSKHYFSHETPRFGQPFWLLRFSFLPSHLILSRRHPAVYRLSVWLSHPLVGQDLWLCARLCLRCPSSPLVSSGFCLRLSPVVTWLRLTKRKLQRLDMEIIRNAVWLSGICFGNRLACSHNAG